MDQRIKLFFSNQGMKSLEKEVNHFLRNTDGNFISAEYDTILAIDEWGTGILVTYIPKECIDTRKKVIEIGNKIAKKGNTNEL